MIPKNNKSVILDIGPSPIKDLDRAPSRKISDEGDEERRRRWKEYYARLNELMKHRASQAVGRRKFGAHSANGLDSSIESKLLVLGAKIIFPQHPPEAPSRTRSGHRSNILPGESDHTSAVHAS